MQALSSVARGGAVALLLAVAGAAAACQSNESLPLLTDPHEIVTAAATSAAALGSVHVQIDLRGQNRDPVGGQEGIRFQIAADIDVQARNVGGRTIMTQDNGANSAETSEFILVGGKLFRHLTTDPRWTVANNGGGGDHLPSNAEYVDAIEQAVTNGSAVLTLADAVQCGESTCYHVTASLNEAATRDLLVAPLIGQPPTEGAVPDFPVSAGQVDVFVDQATRTLSGLTIAFTVQQTAVSVSIAFSNHDVPIRIGHPPLQLVDDLSGGGAQPGVQAAPTPQPQPVESTP